MKKKIKIKKESLIKNIKIFNMIYDKKNEYIEVYSEKKKLFFRYKTLNIQIIILIKKDIYLKNLLINFKDFTNLLKNFKNNYLKIIIIKKKLILKDETKYIIGLERNKNKKKNFINGKNFIKIKKKDLLKIIEYSKFIHKTQENNLKYILIICKINNIKIIFNDNYHLICQNIKNYENINLKNKKNILINGKVFTILEFLIEKIKKYLNIKIYKKYFIIKIEKYKLILKFKSYKNIIIKDFKKKFKNYLFLKKKKLEKFLKNFSSFLTKNQKEISIEINKNYLIAKKKIKKNLIYKKIKIFYKGEKIKFFVNGLNLINFLKIIKFEDLILNFSKKKSLVITLPQIKNFKYIISIIKE